MSKKHHSFKQYFITGTLVWLPMGITVWVLTWLVGVFDGIFLAVLQAADSLIPGMHALAEQLRGVPGLGVILVLLVFLASGVFVTNVFGQWWLRQWDGFMNRIPVVRSIYTSVKRGRHALFGQWQRLFQGTAGAVSAPGLVDDRLSDRPARRRGGPAF